MDSQKPLAPSAHIGVNLAMPSWPYVTPTVNPLTAISPPRGRWWRAALSLLALRERMTELLVLIDLNLAVGQPSIEDLKC